MNPPDADAEQDDAEDSQHGKIQTHMHHIGTMYCSMQDINTVRQRQYEGERP